MLCVALLASACAGLPAGAAEGDSRVEVARTGRYAPVGMVVRQGMGTLDGSTEMRRIFSIGTAYLVDTCHIVTNNHLIQSPGVDAGEVTTQQTSVFMVGMGAKAQGGDTWITTDSGPLPDAGPPSSMLPYFAAASTAHPVVWGPWQRHDRNTGAPPEARYDWALLQLDDCLGERFGAVAPYAPLASASVGGWPVGDAERHNLLPEIADVVGHPRDRGIDRATVSQNCSWRPYRETLPDSLIHTSVMLSSNCPTVPGNSGGPVLVANAEMGKPVAVGLVTGAKLEPDAALSTESVSVSDRAARLALTLLQQRGPAVEETVAAAQKLLARLGYDVGAADGVAGPRTQLAVEAYRQRRARESFLPASELPLGYPYAVTPDFARIEPAIDSGLVADLAAAARQPVSQALFDGRWCGLGTDYQLSLQSSGSETMLASFAEHDGAPALPSVRHRFLQDGARAIVLVRHPTTHGQLWWLYLSAIDERLLVLDALVEAPLSPDADGRPTASAANQWEVHPLGVALRRCPLALPSTAFNLPPMFSPAP